MNQTPRDNAGPFGPGIYSYTRKQAVADKFAAEYVIRFNLACYACQLGRLAVRVILVSIRAPAFRPERLQRRAILRR
jgi:hypothetical protein